MIKQLTESEYNNTLGQYNVVHSIGGYRGNDETKTVYLVGAEIWLVDDSDEYCDFVKNLKDRQLTEAINYMRETEH